MNSSAQAVVLAIVLLLVHSVEEIAAGFRHRFPLGAIPNCLYTTITSLLYGFCLAALVLTALNQPAGLVLAWILSAILILNSLGHLGIMMKRRRYFPGGLTAILLPVASAVLIDTLLS